ncbi:MAG: 30S ribosomal protein S20 [bacterium]|nr:30S ribosomal protein S20 [bacterium]
MPQHKSAKKRVKQNAKKNLINRMTKSRIKTFEKKLISAIGDQNETESEKLLRETIHYIDTAATHKVIHKNKADRKKARLTKKVNELSKSKQA